MSNAFRIAFGFGLLSIGSLRAQAGPKQSFETTSTERVNFTPGGTIHLQNSYGYLSVEGWDEPEVEITVTKSTDKFYEPRQENRAKRNFDDIQVATKRNSDHDVAISTTLPARNSLFTSVLPSGRIVVTWPLQKNKRGITTECRIRVPRTSRLVIQHDKGYVWVSDVTGDIEVRSHTGDMIVLLPDPGPYSIDARTRMGSVTSDFAGRTKSQFLIGTRFGLASEDEPVKQVHLRMGRGSITIKNGPPSGPFLEN
jgi:hypothetical protein